MYTSLETQWVDRFVLKLGSLAAGHPAEEFRDLGRELYPDLNSVAPEDVAQVEWEESLRPHH